MEYLESFLNDPFTLNLYLPKLLSLLTEYPSVKRPLVERLLPETIDRLLQNHTSGLLSLIPFSPYLNELVNLVPIEGLQDELEAIRTHAASTFDLIIDLSALFSCFFQKKTAHASRVFTMILEGLVDEPHLAEDAGLLHKLHRFKPGRDCVMNKISSIEEAFESNLRAMISMPYAFNMISIQDMWRTLSNQMRALQLVFDVPSTVPTDKYQLYASIAGVLMQRADSAFELSRFMDALEIAPVSISAESNSIYERTLIELLITFDNANLRRQIVDRLDEHVALYKPWKTSVYSGSSLLYHAVYHGNLGLLKWMNASHPRPILTKNALNNLCIEAAVLGHWPIVGFFLKSFHLTQLTANTVLHQAVLQNQVSILNCLWQPQKKSPSRKNVETAFLNAVRQSSYEMTCMIMQSASMPSDTTLTRGFKQALNSKEYSIALEIASHGGQFNCLNAAVNQALLDAARHNNVSTLFCLRLLAAGILSQKSLDDALIYAVRAGAYDAVQSVLQLFDMKPRFQVRVLALRHAEKKGFHDIARALGSDTLVPLPVLERESQDKKLNHHLPKAQSCQLLAAQSPVRKGLSRRYDFFKLAQNKSDMNEPLSGCMPPTLSRQRSV